MCEIDVDRIRFKCRQALNCNWLRKYLDSRLQLVSVNGQQPSSLLLVTSGVPQGSILRPLLFLVYINDLSGYVHYSRLLPFADETSV